MKQPSLDVLMTHVDSKYTLVVVAAKRARELMADSNTDEPEDIKPVSRALEEMSQDKISFSLVKEVRT